MSAFFDFATGFSSLVTGFKLLRQERHLWKFLLAPIIIGILASLPVLYFAGDLWSLLREFLPLFASPLPAEGGGAIAHALLSFGVALLRWSAHLIAALLLIVIALFVIVGIVKIAAAPFNDFLSEAVERIDAGKEGAPLEIPPFFRSLIKALVVTIFQLILFLLFLAPLWLLSLLLPGAGAMIASVLLLLYSAFWLTYDAMSYAMDRRLWSLRRRLHLMSRHPVASLSFGIGCYAIMLIPLVNLFLFPLFVSGGTVLLRRLEISGSFSAEPSLASKKAL